MVAKYNSSSHLSPRKLENYGDIEPGLRAAFEAGKQALRKWKDEMEKNEIYFAAHMLDPRIKFRLIREQYGDGADAIIDDVKAWCKKHYPPRGRLHVP
ncbi:hypothetical protein V8E54_003181 [Elaphomyces granulatus]